MKKQDHKKEVFIPTKFGEFLCIFESNYPDSGFTVTSSAAPGFVAYGRNFQEAKKTAKSGLEFHCECVWLEHVSRPGHAAEKITI